MHLSIGSLEDRQSTEQEHKYFSPGKPNWEKPSNLRLEKIILRSEYNEEKKKKNMEMPSKYETLKISLLKSCCVAAVFPRKLRTAV